MSFDDCYAHDIEGVRCQSGQPVAMPLWKCVRQVTIINVRMAGDVDRQRVDDHAVRREFMIGEDE